jgi:sensor histidine kinase regulating citrate/malate metabolism
MRGITKALKHYVANKLQTIMGYVDLAEIAKTPAERDKHLTKAKEAIRQLDATLNDEIVPSIRREP